MYICLECRRTFDECGRDSEDRTPGGAFEGGSFIQHFNVCPYCGSDDFEECAECDNCSRAFADSEIREYLCEECYKEVYGEE